MWKKHVPHELPHRAYFLIWKYVVLWQHQRQIVVDPIQLNAVHVFLIRQALRYTKARTGQIYWTPYHWQLFLLLKTFTMSQWRHAYWSYTAGSRPASHQNMMREEVFTFPTFLTLWRWVEELDRDGQYWYMPWHSHDHSLPKQQQQNTGSNRLDQLLCKKSLITEISRFHGGKGMLRSPSKLLAN